MDERAAVVLEEYDLEVQSIAKGRGALICETSSGLYILREYRGTREKLEKQEAVLSYLQNNSDISVEKPIRTKEDGLIVIDKDQTPYILKSYFVGRELDLTSKDERIEAVKTLASLHKSLTIPEIIRQNGIPKVNAADEYDKRNRELRHVRKYLKEKTIKTEFEIYLKQNYDIYYDQAIKVAEEMRAYQLGYDKLGKVGNDTLCHGDYQYHNLIISNGKISIINFERMIADNPMRDLSFFLRKILEKNNWSQSMSDELLAAYGRIRPLSPDDYMQLYFRLSYPEKFWKIVNFYINSTKVWIPQKNREKLQKYIEMTDARERFIIWNGLL